jgi:hypothetical protein
MLLIVGLALLFRNMKAQRLKLSDCGGSTLLKEQNERFQSKHQASA